MFRLILWLGLGYLLFRLFCGRPAVPGASDYRSKTSASGEKMVKCLRCGLYVPEHEALTGGLRNPGGYFCSRECQQKKPV